jgi:ATP-dependent 26S proteasome regulatory subunit
MDDAGIDGLVTALQSSPSNHALRLVLVHALLDRDETDRAASHLAGLKPDDLVEEEQRREVAELLVRTGEPARALKFAAVDSPASLLVRARALLALDRQDDARDCYTAAVDQNPTLEDLDLKTRLFARVHSAKQSAQDGDNVVRLSVLANDDTDDSELGRLLQPEQRHVSFIDVGGLENVKKQVQRRIITPFEKPSLFAKYKKKVGGGILMFGPPGCGKTLLARATAGECDARFLAVAISDVLDMYIGESERKLHALFEKARSDVPCVLFFDELEALAGKRQYSREQHASKLVSQFLAEMDGFAQNNSGVLILGATNVPWAIDPAFRRPGRFDRVLFVPPPDRVARESILRILSAERPFDGDVDFDKIAKRTSGFSGADLENVVETAVDEALDASLDEGRELPITQRHLDAALKQVKPTTHEWLTTARNHARYANESGQYDDVLEFLERHGKG